MSCDSCFNGCGTPTPDACVIYTGLDSPLLGIKTGDPLSKLEAEIISKLTDYATGVGITLPDIDLNCQYIKDLLGCEDKTLANLVQVLVDASCNLKTLVDALSAKVNAPFSFSTSCLTGLTPTSSRDAILQAVINKVCSMSTTLDTVSSDYVKASDFNSLVAQYIAGSSPTTAQQNAKMVPMVAYEYYGPLSNFDNSGKGLSSAGFEKVYLCNGSNGTPDKRGRVAVGAVQGVPGGALDPAVDPTIPANAGIGYSLGQKFGAAFVTLTSNEIPAHTHAITDPGHVHAVTYGQDKASGNNNGGYQQISDSLSKNTKPAFTGIVIGSTGGGQQHENRQPSIAANFIMYIP